MQIFSIDQIFFVKDWCITILAFSGAIGLISIGAGLLGSLTGLGGGIVVVPFLTLVLGVDLHYAIGASLISVISTSSGSAIAHVKGGFANIKVGMLLEIAAASGALLATLITSLIAPRWVAMLFGIVLLHSAYMTFINRKIEHLNLQPDSLATSLRLNGEYHSENGLCKYNIQSVPCGFTTMLIAGFISGLLGIGSGALKVIGMDHIMKIPYKVSTATSNFMIGMTAAASAGIYFSRGYIDPGLSMPVMLGVLLGSFFGSRYLKNARTATLRTIFVITIVILGIQMIYNGISGKL